MIISKDFFFILYFEMPVCFKIYFSTQCKEIVELYLFVDFYF